MKKDQPKKMLDLFANDDKEMNELESYLREKEMIRRGQKAARL